MRAMDFVSCFGGGGALSSNVALVDDGKMQKIATKRQVEMLNRPLLERFWFEVGKIVDG